MTKTTKTQEEIDQMLEWLDKPLWQREWEALEGPETCSLCGSEEHTQLGTLGNLTWWRCNGCGCESCTPAR